MNSKFLNLIDAHFQNSILFKYLPVFDAIYYEGHPEGKIQRYRAIRENQECTLLALTIIRKEEDILWDAAEDLLIRSVQEAATRVQGVFTFDLLTFDVHGEANNFDFNELGTLLVNHSLKTKPGEQRLIKYSSAYGLLQKLVVEPWGKITFKTSVEVFKDKPAFLFALVNRLFKLAEFSRNPLIISLNDVSSNPVYDPKDTDQQNFLSKIITEKSESNIEFLPEVYIQDKNGVRELMSGSIVR